jgi:hypothetical protein
VFWQRIKFLVKIVIPTWKCVEVFDLLLLTLFLVFRTFLSIYLAGVNGRIVKAIIEMDFSMFIKRVPRSINHRLSTLLSSQFPLLS